MGRKPGKPEVPGGTGYEVVLMPLADLKPYEKNPRKNDDAVAAVAPSIKRFGFKQPIVVDEQGVIIVGHTRYKAAKRLKLERVPVHVAKGLSASEVRAYRLADNATNDRSDWDMQLLPIEIGELKDMEFNLADLGFADETMEELLGLVPGATGLTDPDQVPEPPDAAVTQPGDLWILGDHRLLCGDAGKAEDVDRLLEGAAIQLVNTDPPYNVNNSPRTGNAQAAGAKGLPHDSRNVQKVLGHNKGLTDAQRFDASRLGRSKATTPKMRPRDRVLDNDARTLVRKHCSRVGAGKGFLHLGRLRQLGELLSRDGKCRPVLRPRNYMGEGSCRVGQKGLHERL